MYFLGFNLDMNSVPTKDTQLSVLKDKLNLSKTNYEFTFKVPL